MKNPLCLVGMHRWVWWTQLRQVRTCRSCPTWEAWSPWLRHDKPRWYERLARRAEINGRVLEIRNRKDSSLYLRRFYLFRSSWLGIFLHCFEASDDSLIDLHDHPWASVSVILARGYTEILPMHDHREDCDSWGCYRAVRRSAGSITFRRASDRHSIDVRREDRGRTWTLFVRFRKSRTWGFHTSQGWLPWWTYCGLPAEPAEEE